MLQIWGYHISSYLYEFAYVIPHSGLLIFSYLNTLYLCIRNNKLFKGYSFFFIRANNIFQEVNFLNKYIFAMDSLDQIRALVHTLPSSDFLIRAIEAATSGITIADFQSEDMPVIYAHPAYTRITGYPVEEALGKNCRYLQGQEVNQVAIRTIRMALKESKPCKVLPKNFKKDGTGADHFKETDRNAWRGNPCEKPRGRRDPIYLLDP